MEDTYKMLEFLDDDSDDEKIVSFINSITEEEVDGETKQFAIPSKPGSNNDINVLNASPIFNSIKDGTAPPSPFDVNWRHYERGYYLGDGIYPDWAMLGRFAMLKTPARYKDFNKIRRAMYACIVLHNMIQENNGFAIGRREERMIERNPPRRLQRDLRDRDARVKEIRGKQVHQQLEADLTEHVWNLSPYFRSANNNE
ncbi:uncharacterized protein [Rutidosis leptorrhynchoides]|uniref:uncharacterized protein n=1 Tax=Rutidosis leptorrhynchoides TaxID=125765 RepID=UPI003A992D58